MRLFPTVKGPNCKGCGNPWFFMRLEGYECTTCALLDPEGILASVPATAPAKCEGPIQN